MCELCQQGRKKTRYNERIGEVFQQSVNGFAGKAYKLIYRLVYTKPSKRLAFCVVLNTCKFGNVARQRSRIQWFPIMTFKTALAGQVHQSMTL